MGLEAVFQQKYEKIVMRAFQTGLRGAFIEGCSMGVYDALAYISEAIFMSVGAVLVANGTYNISEMFQTVFLLVFTITFCAQDMAFSE
jgi:ATP-binding cassette, subfamily B (MDR/TAP), member 1